MNTPNEMPRPVPNCFGYIRFSKEEQGRGASLARQTEEITAFCAKHPELPAPNLTAYRDLGVSGWSGANLEKGALGRLLSDVREGRIPRGSWIVVERLDRLSRQPVEETFSFLKQFTDAGLIFATAKDGTVFKKGNYDLIVVIKAAVAADLAHNESQKKSENVCDAWARKRSAIASGKKMTAKAPGWLTLSKDKTAFSVIEERAAVVRRIFDETAEGRGATAIAKRLNGDKVATFRDAEGWASTTVRDILRSRSVLGEFAPCKMEKGERVPVGEAIPDYFPRIVSDAQFYAAQMVMSKRTNAGGRSVASVNCLFTRICFCGQCGGPMHYTDKGRGSVYLRCDRTARKLAKCEPMGRRYAPIEAAFIRWVVNFDFTGTTKGERANLVDALAAAEGGAAEANRKALRLAEAMAVSNDLVSTFVPLIQKEKANADRLAKEAARLKGELATITDKNPNINAEEAAKNPENRLRLREEIRQRVNRLVITKQGSLRVELKDGRVINAQDDKTLLVDLGRKHPTRIYLPK